MSKKEEKNGKRSIESDDSFELVSGKKKNTGAGCSGSGSGLAGRDWSAVKAPSKTKPKVPFHIRTIRKPQEEFNFLVDNSNNPFNHVLLQKSEDGKRFIHPLEKLSVSDFVDKDVGNVEPMKPLSLDCTPFQHIEEVEDLKELAAKLRSVDEFAVDLEHNQYRSFQGLTCLMQISTRTEDFIVDTLKLRVHVGPYLREVFKDPTKKKVMHGADRDIIWLQQDFGIYVCNLFDTGQASRVLKLERNSLEYLLLHFCGVAANKQYQKSDWRLRPLPSEMVRYAREDTHYLLYIYDLMRIKLSSIPIPEESGNADAPLLDVYKRSYAICMHLYEKELLTEDSFLSLYGLPSAGLNAQQLAIVAGLYEWRDAVARAEDESTGFILPNKTLLEIAKQMPVTTNKLHRLVKSKHWYIERDLASVVSVIRHAMLSGAAFEATAELLRQRHLEMVAKERARANDGLEVDPQDGAVAMDENIEPLDFGCSTSEEVIDRKGGSSEHPHANGEVKIKSGNFNPKLLTGEHTSSAQNHHSSTNAFSFSLSEITGTTLPMRRKPDRSFVALRTFTPIRNFESGKKDKEELKLGKEAQLNPVHNGPSQALGTILPEEPPSALVSSTNEKDIIIILDDDSDMEYSNSETKNEWEGGEEDEPRSQLKPVQEGTSRGMDIMHPEKTFATSVASTNQIDIITIDDDSDSDDDWDQI